MRRLQPSDAPAIIKWLSDSRVSAWYGGRGNESELRGVLAKCYSKENDPLTACIVELDGLPIGYIQFYPLEAVEKNEYGYRGDERAFGIDLFIGAVEIWNRGVGTRLISTMVTHLCERAGASKVVVDPWVDNARAIRCYEKCGFQKIRYLTSHQLHEGVMQDCWLMEFQANAFKRRAASRAG